MQGSHQTSKDKQTKLTHFLNSRVPHKPSITKHPEHLTQNLKLPWPDKKERQSQRSGNSNRSHHSRTESLNSSLSASSHSPLAIRDKLSPLQPKPQEKQLNVEFYLNKMPSQPNGEFIDKMHAKWHNDYERLQRDHSFIQWLFPNSFQSRFNSHARPLSSAEVVRFKASPEILERYVRSYTIMLGFYGIKLKSKVTGQLGRSRHPDYKERFYKTLLTSFHNHMRITRMLCSLSELGFKQYATHLCRFLHEEIYGPDGALRNLAKYNIYEQWKPFEKCVEDEANTNCFMSRLKKAHKPLRHEVLVSVEEKKQFVESEQIESGEGQRHPRQP